MKIFLFLAAVVSLAFSAFAASAASVQEQLLRSLSHAADEEMGYKYFGEKITVDWKDARLGDVIGQLAAKYKFEAVVDPALADQKVSGSFVKMPWDAALYNALSSAGAKVSADGAKLRFDAKKK